MDVRQLQFARTHGIKVLPPSPIGRMAWHGVGDSRASEAELIAEFSGAWTPKEFMGMDLTQQKLRSAKRRKQI